MRKSKKGWTVCLLAAVMALVSLGGCQKAGTFPGENPAAAERAGSSEPQKKKEEENQMSGQSYGRGTTWEAKEPERAELSPEDYEGWNQLLDENRISGEFTKGLDLFAYKSGSVVLKNTQENGNYSPLSLYYTLALAGCGARGETAAQILENLGMEDKEDLAEQCGRLYRQYVYQSQREKEQMEHYGMEGYKSAICLGNSLWISDQLPVEEKYQEMAAEKFYASSYGVDFSDSETGKRMGEWIAHKTKGVLAPQITTDSGTLLTILNTLYFYGGWREPFSQEMTQEDSFTREDGGRITVPYLNRTELTGEFQKREGGTLSYLSTDNNCRMVFLLPDEGRTVGEFLESPQKLRASMELTDEDWKSGKVIWKVPKFSFGSSYPLKDTLKAMGMERMFESEADLGDISTEPLRVSHVIQETHIGIDEQGVEGAAYTMMAVAGGAMTERKETAEMILDRPFLYGIWDDSHGLWLFLGVCRDPSR